MLFFKKIKQMSIDTTLHWLVVDVTISLLIIIKVRTDGYTVKKIVLHFFPTLFPFLRVQQAQKPNPTTDVVIKA